MRRVTITLAAFRAFRDEVKELIGARVLAMQRHPQWAYWFPVVIVHPTT